MSKPEHDRTIDYIEFGATDIAATKRFYAACFGWKFTDYGPNYVAFDDGRLTGGFTTESKPGGAPLVVLYASKLEEIFAAVKAQRGRIVREIFSFPGGRRFHFLDPNGNELAVWSVTPPNRDIADLCASGVPIDGEAGVGYRLHPHFDLPPLMFSYEEIDALVMGARFVESWGGPRLANAARAALAKIAAALPEQKRAAVHESRLFAPGFFIDPQWGTRLDSLRTAIVKHRYVEFEYRDGHAQDSQRRVRPFAVFFWGGTWTLGAWCELRRDFRNFRLDRFVSLQICEQEFPDEPGRRFDDYMKRMTES